MVSRLFPDIKQCDETLFLSKMEADEGSLLKEVSNLMTCDQLASSGFVPAGLTYIGQMVSHDIVPPTNQTTRNFKASPALNLNSVYGSTAQSDQFFDCQGCFRLGKSVSSDASGKSNGFKDNKDILREPNGSPKIGDLRNDENVIVSQLHLLWQKMHNCILLDSKFAMPRDNKVREVRKIVSTIFQWITVYEFLQNVLDSDVFNLYFKQHQQFLYSDQNTLNTIPIEFSHACFRFGHSMIRDNYEINQKDRFIELNKLFVSKSNGALIDCSDAFGLNDNLAVNFELFFDPLNVDENAMVQKAFGIDTMIAPSMSNLTLPHGRTVPHSFDIVSHNVIAGEDVCMPNGNMVFQALREHESDIFQAANFSNSAHYGDNGRIALMTTSLAQYEVNDSLNDWPLWLYSLIEAHIQQDRKRLGKVASVVVAEVLSQSIRQANPSFFGDVVEFQNSGRYPFPIMSCIATNNDLVMHDIVKYVNQRY